MAENQTGTNSAKLRECSFCGRNEMQVNFLIPGGNGAYISTLAIRLYQNIQRRKAQSMLCMQKKFRSRRRSKACWMNMLSARRLRKLHFLSRYTTITNGFYGATADARKTTTWRFRKAMFCFWDPPASERRFWRRRLPEP